MDSYDKRMRPINVKPTLVDQVVEAIVSEIVEGELPSNARLIQDELARAYGVSRQPVQQALLLLRSHGLVREARGRGLIVSPLDAVFVRNLYEVRSMLEGLAARLAAERGAERAKKEGSRHIAQGRAAIENGTLSEQIAADLAFHTFLSELSGNPLIGETTAPHWPCMRRVMGEVLREDEKMPKTIWDEHSAILDAVMAGNSDRAETLSRQHILRAANVFVERLQAREEASEVGLNRRSRLIPR
jgi:DNA-binding GntR family transcriptional regulator